MRATDQADGHWMKRSNFRGGKRSRIKMAAKRQKRFHFKGRQGSEKKRDTHRDGLREDAEKGKIGR